MIKKQVTTLRDEETGVVVEKESSDVFFIHLGNKDFALEMSKDELKAIKNLIVEILENN